MIHIHLEDENVSMKTILEYIGLRKSSALIINKVLIPLVEKEWITPKKDIRLNPLTEYSINNKLIRSVLKGKLEINGEVSIENSYQLIVHFKRN